MTPTAHSITMAATRVAHRRAARASRSLTPLASDHLITRWPMTSAMAIKMRKPASDMKSPWSERKKPSQANPSVVGVMELVLRVAARDCELAIAAAVHLLWRIMTQLLYVFV